jgi:hypothetical protein
MADTGVIDLDASIVMEKRGRGHPCSSKNKPKDLSTVASSSAMPMKHRPGCPLGNKDKPKPSSSIARQIVDANTAPRNASLIGPKLIYFPKHFCCCFSSNLCVLNTTNMD